VAADHAELARKTRRQYTIDDREVLIDVWLVALIAAHRGELDRVRALVESTRPHATLSVDRSGHDGVLGLVELWSGHPGEAAILFAAADEDRLGSGVNEPTLFWWRADYAEALLALGRVDEAAELVDAWYVDAARLGRETVVAHATRCRGLVAAARGEIEVALAELARAVEQHEAVGDPFGRARALLALGTVRRRARQKRAAREAIEAALAGFEECGATGWAEKARAELGTIGGRRRIEGLTPAEGRIAALVAAGQTNREVAAALFLTEQTVATTLTRVYRKLGVRSRVELASRHAAKT
jgi:DNA-binding CsgD family transcriptional regulator